MLDSNGSKRSPMEAITGTGHGATTSNTYFENLNES
jgi:hypothetical protein